MHKRLIHLTLVVAVSGFVLERAHAALPAPVAHWSFDGNGLDSSGNHNNATLHGKISYAPGLHGPAAQFQGQGDYFQVANNPAIQLRSTGQFSVTAYVQPANLNEQVILNHGNISSSPASWSLSVQGDMPAPNMPLYPGCFVFSTRESIPIDPGTTPKTTPTSPPISATGKAVAGQWAHLAATYDGATLKLYVDGVLQSSVAAPLPYDNAYDLYIGGAPGWISGRSWYAGLVDDVYIFSQALTDEEIKEVMRGPVQAELASRPSPAQGAVDVARDTPFRWTAGKFAVTHDVYLGKTFAEVDGASRTKAGGILVSQAQAGTTYTPPGVLDFGQTCFWRVDEFGKAPDGTISYKGNVWGFTVEPYSYPIPGASITATASGSMAGWGPEKTIDGSGLAGDLHGTDNYTMWQSLGKLPAWIQYQFDKVYKLDKLLVWNSNQPVEFFVGTGAKNVKVEYSTDGATWTVLANVPQFAMAPGKPNYAANTTVNFGGVSAQYVKLTINANWGGQPETGLSAVRFSYVPLQARSAAPAPDATGQSIDTLLNWRPGREAVSHKVFFGTDPNAVANGTAPAQTVTDHAFDPGSLNYGTTYYWRIDEIGATGTYPGDVWSFTTQEFAAVDDFESYNDANNRIHDTWIDGLTDGKSGSAVGYMDAPFAEQTIVHRGKQSMPLAYDNSKSPFYSETTRDLGTAQDWTGNGATHMDLWFCGYPAPTSAGAQSTSPRYNVPARLYVVIQDSAGHSKLEVHPDPAATNAGAWTQWTIPLSDLTAAGVQTTQIRKITIGVGDKRSPTVGGVGLLYLDDLGYGHPANLPVQAHTPQPADGAVGRSLTTTLSWRPARDAGSHQVFFGTDLDAVANGKVIAKTVTNPAFDPGTLNYGTTYYWRVDEVNTVTYPGEVWSFTTQEFAVVDNFEGYNDTDFRIYSTWTDGYTDHKSGSTVGYMNAPFAEQKIVHGGRQSMPLAYDNSKSPFYSEASRYLGGPQDWTGHGATHLDLWFRGYPATGVTTPSNAPASLYLIVTDKAGASRMVVHPNPTATVMTDWTEWRIPLSDLTGINLTMVQKLTLGVGDKNSPKAGGTGMLYIDDIGYGHPVQ
ncbi:MAG: discoidin domain-containing protein [Phycisphaerae bacterium]|nr:discoidin domain-containing protein [Phycisphaerae bacterium]